ncbi:MAG: SH3 domain-containing protein [Mailhella sp.]|nr:SH3 domain-containing protein [Mailhella sp.]
MNMLHYFPMRDLQKKNVVFRARASLCCLTACLLLLAACAGQPPKVNEEQNFPGEVQDIRQIPQSLEWFARQPGSGTAQDSSVLKSNAVSYLKKFFYPWDKRRSGSGDIAELKRIYNWREDKRGFAENLQPWTAKAWQNLAENADFAHFKGICRPAITTHATDLRLAPTISPRFARITGAGQGYPFDDFQLSRLPVGLPVTVAHVSMDGAWFLVHSSLASGWVHAEHVGFADEFLQSVWRSSDFYAFIKDEVPLSANGCFLGMAGIGTILPKDGENKVLVPARGRNGAAEIARVQLQDASAAEDFPLQFSRQRVAAIGDRMMGEKYGWGGLYGNRDCSATMKDLFCPFGIWLPRNSAAQAKAGEYHSLEHVPAAARDAAILKNGLPFRTLVCMKGHIGLYAGAFQGKPVFFHNAWGLRNRLSDGRTGRVILGRAVITGTRPGKERADMPEDRLMIHNIRGLSIIGGR